MESMEKYLNTWKQICSDNIYQTSEIYSAIEKDIGFGKEIKECFDKYTAMNWGNTCKIDSEGNNKAVICGNDRVLAKYETSKGNVFIITEWDRSATTILFAHEY